MADVIKTDHRSLKHLMDQVIQTPEQHRYLSKLLGFNYTIVYKPGKENVVADALSRVDEDMIDDVSTQKDYQYLFTEGVYHALTTVSSNLLDALRAEVLQNSELQAIVQEIAKGKAEHYVLRDGLLYFKNKLRVAADSTLRSIILHEFHNSPIGGHAGILKTFLKVSTSFYWPGLRSDVKQYVGKCLVCQQIKYPTSKVAGLLQPLPIPENIWEDISMDFITGLPVSKGVSVILVVVDRLSKAAHFGTLPASFTAITVANLFTDIVVKHHGFPISIVSDRDPIFLSKFWQALFQFSGTALKYSTAYHPQIDG